MKTFDELLIELGACKSFIKWAENRTTDEQIVKDCPRGHWLLWLASKIDLPIRKLTLAKALCAKTVIHLMKDERSIKAVETAERFGRGECDSFELKDAINAARSAARSAAFDLSDYAATAAYTSAADTVDPTDGDVAYNAAYAAAAAYVAAGTDAKTENQLQTADICREVLGKLIINRIYELRTIK